MSDDEYDSPEAVQILTTDPSAIATRQNTTASTSSHRKGPRFSWNPQYEATFFRSLCESVKMGLKDNHSFKPEAWDRACAALADRHNAYPTKSHLINKSDNARKKFRLWRGLREDPEFLYNPKTRIVTASDSAWRAHIEREPLSKSLRNRAFEHEDYMEILFPDVIGSGGAPRRITRPRRRGADALGDADDMDGAGAATAGAGATSNNVLTLLSPSTNQAATFQSGHNPILPANLSSHGSLRNGANITANRTSIASSSALTPPDDDAPNTASGASAANAHSRKHHLSSGNNGSSGGPIEKRRRTANNNNNNNNRNNFIDLTHSAQHLMNMEANNNNHAHLLDSSHTGGGSNITSNAHSAPTHQPGSTAANHNGHNTNNHVNNNLHPSSAPVSRQQLSEAMLALNEFVRNFRNAPPQQQAPSLVPAAVAAPPAPSTMQQQQQQQQHHHQPHPTTTTHLIRWQEQAMETFFREFADEDADLQIRIGEKVLCDSHKAMMFCQMSEQLRKHWVRRLRELHNRHDTTSSGSSTLSNNMYGAGGAVGGVNHTNNNNNNSGSQTTFGSSIATTGGGGGGGIGPSSSNNTMNMGNPATSSAAGAGAGLLTGASLGGVPGGGLLQQQMSGSGANGAGALTLGRNGSG